MSSSSRDGQNPIVPAMSIQGATPPRQVSVVPRYCVYCKGLVETDAIYCTKCNSVYHQECTKRLHISSEGVFKRCCGSRQNSPNRENTSFSLDDLMQAMRTEFDPKLAAINNKIDLNLAAINTVIDAKLEGINKKIDDNLDVYKNMLDDRLGLVNAKIDESQSKLLQTAGRVSIVEADVTDLKSKLGSLESTETGNNNNRLRDGNVMSTCLKEVMDRAARKHNLILLGSNESNVVDGAARLTADRGIIQQLFIALNITPPVNPTDIRCFRIGKFSPNLAKPRRLKFTLPHSLIGLNILQQFIRMKKAGSLPQALADLILHLDLTPMQIQDRQAAYTELAERTKLGEAGLSVHMRNGFPKIVHSSGPRVVQQTQSSAPATSDTLDPGDRQKII